jgi:hypothetical protein
VNINECYEIVKLACAKNTSQGYISPDDFNLNINLAQGGFVSFLIGQYQQYQAKRPIPVVAFGETERIRTSVAPLIYETIIPVNGITGIGAFPYGFLQVDAMWGQYGYYNIRFTEQDRLGSNIRSVIDTPTTQNAVYLIRHEGFQFFPESIGNVRCSYVSNPPSMRWGYVNNPVTGVPEYNAATSSQPVWDDMDIMEILVRTMDLFGVNLQLNAVREYANQIKKGGQ